MKKELRRVRKKRPHWQWRNFFLLILVVSLTVLLNCGQQQPSEEYKKNHPSAKKVGVFFNDISPDGKTILFEYGSPYWSKLGTYNLSTGKIHKYDDDKINKTQERPKYSWDGQKIVYLASNEKDAQKSIYIMNADGSDRMQITNNQKMYVGPSFSPDDKRIIFLRSSMKRERAFPLDGVMDTAWDVYELDIATGNERRLTNYNFYKTGRVMYLADGKRFVLSAEGPVNSTGRGPKNFEEYEKMYQKNFIFIMDGVNNELKPAFVNGSNSDDPYVARDDSIIFSSELIKESSPKITEELFLYKNGKIKQLTTLGAYIRGGKISRDGSMIIFAKYSDKNSYDKSYWIMKKDGTGLRELKIPMDELKK